jgi:hypothetical protein
MAEIDLRQLSGDQIVLHFGGRPSEVDAFTFSNALIAIGEAFREISRQVSPEFKIEVIIDGVGPGSFRARIKTSLKSIGGLFKPSSENLILKLWALIVYERHSDGAIIDITPDHAVLRDGDNVILLPLEVWHARERLPEPNAIEEKVAKTFEILDEDASVTDFGIVPNIGDDEPLAVIPRSDFPRLATPPSLVTEEEGKRYRDERTKLIVIKAVLERSTRKWQFVWNGIRIPAPIKDDVFFEKPRNREVSFTQGDVLNVILRIHQRRDEANGVFLNERYEVIRVFGKDEMPRQHSFV